MTKSLYHFCYPLLLMFAAKNAFGQVVLSGPACVTSGILYEYTIKAEWGASPTVDVCVTNGVIHDSSGNTTCSSIPRNVILVVWNDSASDTGSVSITSSSGNTTLNVNFTHSLLPGTIDSGSKTQIINYGSTCAVINCSADSGGACSPIYKYQWQQSPDQVSWQDVSGANTSFLTVPTQLYRNIYYRRKVTETTSGSIAYSDVASVFVVVIPKDSTITIDPDSTRGSSGAYFQQKAGENTLWAYADQGNKLENQWILDDKGIYKFSVINKCNKKAQM